MATAAHARARTAAPAPLMRELYFGAVGAPGGMVPVDINLADPPLTCVEVAQLALRALPIEPKYPSVYELRVLVKEGASGPAAIVTYFVLPGIRAMDAWANGEVFSLGTSGQARAVLLDDKMFNEGVGNAASIGLADLPVGACFLLTRTWCSPCRCCGGPICSHLSLPGAA
jgi:hypothetical protein